MAQQWTQAINAIDAQLGELDDARDRLLDQAVGEREQQMNQQAHRSSRVTGGVLAALSAVFVLAVNAGLMSLVVSGVIGWLLSLLLILAGLAGIGLGLIMIYKSYK